MPRGIISVLQTPFTDNGDVDLISLGRLVEHAISAGVHGFLVPAVASEVAYLSSEERRTIVDLALRTVAGRVPVIVGASADSAPESVSYIRGMDRTGALGYLVAVPAFVYERQELAEGFFGEIADGSRLPMVIQDLQFGGYGLRLETMKRLWESMPTLAGFKVETVPAGPKYTALRETFGERVFVAGGWAIPQMIEALDRGVDALIPESSMVSVYRAVYDFFVAGRRDEATALFRRLLPVLTFTNQEIGTSVAFFKRLLRRKGVFRCEKMRMKGLLWDKYSERIGEDLVELVLALETDARGTGTPVA